MPSSRESFQILVVDDHEPTARLIATAFDEASDSVTTHRVSTGEECLMILRDESEEPVDPDFILLDLGLPDIDGLAVLEAIRTDPETQHLPVVVLSGQADEDTIHRCYKKGANTFIAKPDTFEEYLALAGLIVDYWGSGASLPHAAAARS